MPWHRLLPALLLAAVVATAAAAADGGRGKQWNLDRIGAPVTGATGGGVVIAVIDTGVDLDHPDLKGQLVAGHDFVDRDDDPDDPHGHGTHVAGIAAAAVGGGEVVGVAPTARIMPLRVLGPDGSGRSSDVAAAVRWAVVNGAKVINLSLGEDTQAVLGSSLTEVVREAWAAGVVPVVAAGNSFVTGSGFSDEPALVVTATTRNDGKPTYSSGTGAAKWGIAAPGGEVPDLGLENAVLSSYADGGYAWSAGTSQAAPHVSAAVAILLDLGLTPQEAVDRLLATAVDLGPAGRDATFGAGRIDLTRAVEGLRSPAQAPTAQPQPTDAPSDDGAPAPRPAGTSPPPPPSSAPPSGTAPDPTDPSQATDTTSIGGGSASTIDIGDDDDTATGEFVPVDPSDPDGEAVPLALTLVAVLAVAAAAAGTGRQWLLERQRG